MMRFEVMITEGRVAKADVIIDQNDEDAYRAAKTHREREAVLYEAAARIADELGLWVSEGACTFAPLPLDGPGDDPGGTRIDSDWYRTAARPGHG